MIMLITETQEELPWRKTQTVIDDSWKTSEHRRRRCEEGPRILPGAPLRPATWSRALPKVVELMSLNEANSDGVMSANNGVVVGV